MSIPKNPFLLGSRVQIADPCYNNDALAGPFESVQDCIDKFPEELKHEGRTVGIKNKQGRIIPYEWNDLGGNEWRLSIAKSLDKASEIVDVPNYSDSVGEVGEKAFDDNYLYLCIEENKWIRMPLDISFNSKKKPVGYDAGTGIGIDNLL
jgi:hypothetical protein